MRFHQEKCKLASKTHFLKRLLCVSQSCLLLTKPSLKIGTANAICWNSLGLFRDNGLDYIFFLGIFFFFFQDRKLKLLGSVCETSQNFNSIRQPIKKDENNNCLNKLNELKFCEVLRI